MSEFKFKVVAVAEKFVVYKGFPIAGAVLKHDIPAGGAVSCGWFSTGDMVVLDPMFVLHQVGVPYEFPVLNNGTSYLIASRADSTYWCIMPKEDAGVAITGQRLERSTTFTLLVGEYLYVSEGDATINGVVRGVNSLILNSSVDTEVICSENSVVAVFKEA